MLSVLFVHVSWCCASCVWYRRRWCRRWCRGERGHPTRSLGPQLCRRLKCAQKNMRARSSLSISMLDAAGLMEDRPGMIAQYAGSRGVWRHASARFVLSIMHLACLGGMGTWILGIYTVYPRIHCRQVRNHQITTDNSCIPHYRDDQNAVGTHPSSLPELKYFDSVRETGPYHCALSYLY